MVSDLQLLLQDQLNQPRGIGRCSEENICIDQDEEFGMPASLKSVLVLSPS